MKYFTADWHLGDDRIGINAKPNLFYRPFKSLEEQNETIVKGIDDSGFVDGDYLYHLGDVFYRECKEEESIMNQIRKKYPNSIFHLIIGNYDEEKIDYLRQWFDRVDHEYKLNYFDFGDVYLNHYPVRTLNLMKDAKLGITAHIHGLWKVQRKLINVGVDAWHFKPVSEKEIEFCYNAMTNHYDENVFPYCL